MSSLISLHRTSLLWMGGLLGCIEQQMNLNIFLPGLILFYFYCILLYFIPYKFYALSALTVTLKIFVV